MTISTAGCLFEEDTGGVFLGDCGLEYWQLLSVLGTGAIDVTDEYGTEVSGLTIGHCYAIESYGGPYHLGDEAHWMATDRYRYRMSNDHSSLPAAYGRMGFSENLDVSYNPAPSTWYLRPPHWAAAGEWVTSNKYYARFYWIASTTSIWIGASDGSGLYGDNTGSLSYRLWDCGEVHTVGCRLG